MSDLPAPDPLSRRDFLRGTCLIGAMLSVGAPLATALSACDSGSPGDGPPPDGVTISGNTITINLAVPGGAPLAAAGGFLYIGEADTIAVNVDGATVRAFSSVCPHEGNAVREFEGGRLICPSHGSQFDTNGGLVSGPAPTGLQPYAVARDGDTVTITRA